MRTGLFVHDLIYRAGTVARRRHRCAINSGDATAIDEYVPVITPIIMQ